MSGDCNVRVDGPDFVEDEDLPVNYLPILGKKRVLFTIHLEGGLTSPDRTAVDAWLGKIISETKGVLVDLQTERFETPTRSGQLDALDFQPNDSGWMSFYFEDGEVFYETGFEGMLEDIAQLMPEALPVRYGEYEPLQSRVEDGDLSELVSSFKADTGTLLKSKAPFGDILVTVPCKKTFENWGPKHFVRREFLLGNVHFEVRPKLFTNPADFIRLKKVFEKLCVRLDVVYAHITRTNTWGSWFWYGLPDHQAHTICLGPAYQSVWTELLNHGRSIGTHHHLVSTDRFGNEPPRPPKNLVAPSQKHQNPGGKPNYADVFPFDFSYDYDRYVW